MMRHKKGRLSTFLLAFALVSVAAIQGWAQEPRVLRLWHHPDLYEDETARLWRRYRSPFSEDQNELISPKTPPSLQIDRDYPKLDGAVQMIPIYAAAAKAIYHHSGGSGEDLRQKAVTFSKTATAAYEALVDGRADMIFAPAPSEEQERQAAEKSIRFTFTPIAREAFVFLVSEQNPVTGLSVAQIRDIYSGKIDNWREVGGKPGKIQAFQRHKGSGSQNFMLREVMGETPIQKPLEAEYYLNAYDGTIRMAADYHTARTVSGYSNLDYAIGYSLRYFAIDLDRSSIPGNRRLAVGGVLPTVENIKNGSYPYTEDFYIVTVRPLSENARKLRLWFVSGEGQQLIAEVGYVPVKGDAN